MKTAVRSEPPLPKTVSRPSAVTPRNPANETTLPISNGLIRASSLFLLRSKAGEASSKLSSVTMGQSRRETCKRLSRCRSVCCSSTRTSRVRRRE